MPQFIRATPTETPDDPDDRVTQIATYLNKAPLDVLARLYGDTAPRTVVVLIDATLRSEAVGMFDLDTLDPPAQCLFDGDAAQDWGNVAPWMVDLSITDPSKDDLSFHRDFFQRHWDTGTSVIVATDAPLSSVRRHLRRFIQLPVVDDGKRRYFRFWDGRVLPGFLQAIADDQDRARRLMMTDDGQALHYLTREDTMCRQWSPDTTSLQNTDIKPMFLRWSDFQPVADARKSARLDRMVARIEKDFAPELKGRASDDIKRTALEAVKRFEAFGFRTHAHLHFFATWSVLYGIGFEEHDSTGRLQEICRSNDPEPERFRAFRKWFDSFKVETG